jgi:hypothetical protein
MLLKGILRTLIHKFGIQDINDKLAEIYDDEYDKTDNGFFDELSESYDKINRYFFKFYQYKQNDKRA